jgi:hypothetical protein
VFRGAVVRAVFVVGLSAVAVVVAATSVSAEWVDSDCDPTAQSCEVGVGTDPQPGGDDGGAPDGGGDYSDGEDPPSVSDPGVPDQEVCETWIEETDLDFFSRAGERPSKDHQLMHTSCKYPDGTGSIDSEWVEVDEDGNPIVDPAVLAQQAADQLQLPNPRIAASPENYQLVRLPTWLWLDGNSWSAQSASASVPGLTVTATATPVKATWDLGDGSTVVCEDAGTEWTPQYDAKDASPDCGHTYAWSSANAPGGEYEVSVVVEWAVSWSGGGQSGTEPGMTTTAQVSWQVAESQATVQ